MSRLSLRVTQVLAGMVALGWTILATLYIRARVQIGHWPQKNLDDPGQLGLGLHYDIAWYGYAAMFFGTLTLALIACVVALVRPESYGRTVRLALVVSILSFALHWFGPISTWYLD